MIIQCEQCSTKFRLDDSKVTDKGVKVRCAKCRHVFTVKKDLPDTEAQPDLDDMFNQPQPDFSAMLDESVALTPGEEPVPPSDLQRENPALAASSAAGFDYSDFVSSDFADQGVNPELGGFTAPQEESAPVSAAGELDFGDFYFGGEVGSGEQPATSHSDEAAERFAFDTRAGGITDSTAAPDAVAVEEASLSPAEPAPKVEESFSLEGFSFGGGQTDEPVKAAAGGPELIGETSRDEAHGASGLASDTNAPGSREPGPAVVAPQAAGEELPPLSIASRRKQSSLFGALIAVIAVVVVTVLGFFGYTMFLEDKGKVVAEAGRITVRAVNASFMKNPVIGDLLVITGEAVNGFTKPRAAIQVKGMVYGANGQVLASKSAYCGNPLTPAQLSTLSLDKIEAAMANQFGDSLANMEVAPGGAIPFVIVIAKPPAEAKDYGVEPAGSTVAAAGKPQ